MKITTTHILIGVAIIGVLLLVGQSFMKKEEEVSNTTTKPVLSENTVTKNYDAFATCLRDNGAKFYGAFWCPHCKAQKELFGSSQSLLPYTECSTEDGKGRTQICIDEEIKGYPTWRFANGTELSGEVSLLKLAEETSCVLP